MSFDRRKFLARGATLVGGSWLLSHELFSNSARAANGTSGFVLSIHAGSWDGLASGLLQPTTEGKFPSGVFVRNQQVPANNPFLNEHITSNGHILHYYNKVLERISNNLLHVTCAPGSLDHNVAKRLQTSGSPAPGGAHWALGAGERLGNSTQSLVVSDSMLSFPSSNAPNAVGVRAGSLQSLRGALGKPRSIRNNPPAAGATALLAAMESSYRLSGRASIVPGTAESALMSTLEASFKGVPEIEPSAEAVKRAIAAINVDRIKARVFETMGGRNNPEAVAVSQVGVINQLAEKLQLAGTLAATGFSPGMAITMPSEDRHDGGSQVMTARIAAAMWAGLTVFWDFIVSEELENKCLAITTHEFGRTPWNAKRPEYEMVHKGNRITVVSPGTDHHPINGVYLLSGKFQGGGRLGGILDGFIAVGAESFNQSPNGNIAAPRTLSVVGSALMAAFPNEFRHNGQPDDGRVVRSIWPDFQNDDIIPAIIGI